MDRLRKIMNFEIECWKDIFFGILFCLASFMLVFNSMTIIIGLIDKIDNNNSSCYSMRRIEYIFPGYSLGCWLGEEID